jgi:hypothetical protein
LPFQSWIWAFKAWVCFSNSNVGNHKLLLEFLTCLLQTCYDLFLLHAGLLHFVVVLSHLFMFTLEMFQITVRLPIELIKFIVLQL